MSFIVKRNPVFTHTVKVQVPVDGGYETQTLKATYNVVPTDEVKSYDLTKGAGSTDFLLRIVATMSDLVGDDNEPVPYNDEIRDLLLSQAYVRTALTRGYFEAVAGAQLGN